ncbi:MAG: hypothetical protein OEO79_06035 [Gemmatimonadota bacterium]|nr:hypothetical protein [Gemmatimonadota bacterium]MDH3422910.1 hypothetical protein [Gemmatimonadota bacterium]
MTESIKSGSVERVSDAPSIRWPPPGLERLQGDLGRVATSAALGGGILVLPLLFVLGRDLDLATLGPFADAWWVTLVLAIIGLTFAADGLVRSMTLLRRISRALEQGYDFETIKLVIADGNRDMGFLLTGGRHFSEVDAKEREAMAALRVFAVTMYAIAGVWLPNALAIGIVLGARGLVSPAGLWMGTALPSLAMYVFGSVAGTVAESRIRRARKRWYRQPWVEDLASDEARSWRAGFAPGGVAKERAAADQSLGRVLRHSAVLTGALAAFIAVPILTLVPTAAVGPILTQLAVPGFDNVRTRGARAEAMRSYRVTTDAGVTPNEAGQLLHDLSFAGSEREVPPGEREPSERIAVAWLPTTDDANPIGVHPFEWPDSLFTVVGRGVTAQQRGYLEGLARHPARASLSRLARAPAIDVASGRYEDPLPDDLTLVTMPIPRYTEFRAATYSHLAAAAIELLDGGTTQAEELVREIVSLGFLLGDGGPTLMDNLIGYALIEQGALALADLYQVTADANKARELNGLQAVADAALSRAHFRYPDGAEAWVRSLPSMVSDTSVARGLRWEIFVGITTLTPCINLQRLVFGPDQEYWDFVNEAYDHLVAWPSEDGLYERARAGWFGSPVGTSGTFVGSILSVAMRTGEGTCGEVVRRLEATEALF